MEVDNTGHCSKDRTPVDISQGFHKCQNSFNLCSLIASDFKTTLDQYT